MSKGPFENSGVTSNGRTERRRVFIYNPKNTMELLHCWNEYKTSVLKVSNGKIDLPNPVWIPYEPCNNVVKELNNYFLSPDFNYDGSPILDDDGYYKSYKIKIVNRKSQNVLALNYTIHVLLPKNNSWVHYKNGWHFPLNDTIGGMLRIIPQNIPAELIFDEPPLVNQYKDSSAQSASQDLRVSQQLPKEKPHVAKFVEQSKSKVTTQQRNEKLKQDRSQIDDGNTTRIVFEPTSNSPSPPTVSHYAAVAKAANESKKNISNYSDFKAKMEKSNSGIKCYLLENTSTGQNWQRNFNENNSQDSGIVLLEYKKFCFVVPFGSRPWQKANLKDWYNESGKGNKYTIIKPALAVQEGDKIKLVSNSDKGSITRDS